MSRLDSAPLVRHARATRLRARGFRYLATRLRHTCVETRERTWATRELARLDRFDRQDTLTALRYARRRSYPRR